MEANNYKKKLATLEAQKKNVCELAENQTYSQELAKERLAEIENRITATRISVSEARIEQFDIEGAVTYAKNFIRNLDRQWFDLSPQLRPRFQKLVFPNGIPYDKELGFRTTELGLIFELNKQFDGTKSSLVDRAGFALERASTQLQKVASFQHRDWQTTRGLVGQTVKPPDVLTSTPRHNEKQRRVALCFVVDRAGFEPATPAMRKQCSTKLS